MFTLLSGKPPFETRNIQETYRRIKRISYKWPSHTNDISHNAKDLVSRILTVDPSKRPNLLQIMQHSFFTKMRVLREMPAFILMRKPMKNEISKYCVENIDDCKSESQNHSNSQSPKKVLDDIDYDFKERNHFIATQTVVQRIQNKEEQQQKRIENEQIPKIKYNEDLCNNLDTNMKMPLIENLKISNVNIEKETKRKEKKNEFIFVVKHCDYSKKYGIGYILSNGFTGIYFNDSTKINLHRDKQSITYLDENDNVQYCTFRNFPCSLSKKIKLLQYFDAYLWNKSENDCNEMDKIKEKLRQKEKERVSDLMLNENKICVKKWQQEKYAMLFRLSNNTVQVNFTDSSKLVFLDSSQLMYQNKNGMKRIYSLDEVYASTQKDLKKRFKYTQQLLKRLQGRRRG